MKKKKAVALRYPEGIEAPVIVAKGEGIVAEKILTEAKKNSIFIEEDSDLVDLLGFGNVGSMVPQSAWEALAVIFSFIMNEDK